MPLARIAVPASLSPAKVSALADAVHFGLVTTCNVPLQGPFPTCFALSVRVDDSRSEFPEFSSDRGSLCR